MSEDRYLNQVSPSTPVEFSGKPVKNTTPTWDEIRRILKKIDLRIEALEAARARASGKGKKEDGYKDLF